MDQIFFGLEQEFVVSQGGSQVDFRRLLPLLGAPGRRIDPGDRNAIRTPLGLALTCDGPEAEFAIPPLLVSGGFTEELLDWAAAGGQLLTGLLGSDHLAEGVSTHLSVSVPDQYSVEVCRLLIDRFAPALMMMVDGFDSPGLLVRPRAGRVELGLDYIAGTPLAAGSALAIGAVTACLKATTGTIDTSALPPRLRFEYVSTTDRYGWYVDRAAFGEDLYTRGRKTQLSNFDGGAKSSSSWPGRQPVNTWLDTACRTTWTPSMTSWPASMIYRWR